MFEYILIAGVNDSDEQAHDTGAACASPLREDQSDSLQHGRRPALVATLAEPAGKFLAYPAPHGAVATLRREKGHDIAAACGQLRLQTEARVGSATARALAD